MYCDKEKLIAVVECGESSDSPGEIRETVENELASTLPRYMIPGIIRFVKEMPRNNAGKLALTAIREMAADDTVCM